MATTDTLQDILGTFMTATESATHALIDLESIAPPENGISLLDAKNEIFLSYLQALALRNLNVIQSLKDGESVEDSQKLSDDLTNKLIEHRVYLERGVRPLEQKIKYQVDKAIKAAEDDDRAVAQKSKAATFTNGATKVEDKDESSSDEDSDSEEAEGSDVPAEEASAHRPQTHRFRQANGNYSREGRESRSRADGVYRPPRISATSMPTTEQRAAKERKPGKSRTMEEYVSNELSAMPMAEPSIGSTIDAGGRRNKDARQMAKEQERRDYEETNLMRLPKESKKERSKQSAKERSGGFGGEEWRGLGDTADRIGDLTKRKGKDSALDKSRKRRAVEDGPRSDGIGNAFEVKKQRMMKKMLR